MKTTILHHGDADGFGAAYACHKAFGDDVIKYISVQYGRPVPEIPSETERLMIVDFSYSREICLKLKEMFKEVIIIDHHKTAEESLKDLPFAHFDLTKSGAVLTWELLNPGMHLPTILAYVQDRDLWKFVLPFSKEINSYIEALDRDFQVWDDFEPEEAISGGLAIEMFRNNQIKMALKNVYDTVISGYKVPTLNCTANISEIGNEICRKYPDAPFSLTYYDRDDEVRSYSLRSIGDFDVSIIARRFGGGGHKNAAGFALKDINII